jgi:hypothetical protein
MKFNDILASLASTNTQVPANRREVISKTANAAGKALVASLPIGLGAVVFPVKAAGSTPEAMNLLLEIKLLLKSLYDQGNAASLSGGGQSGVTSATDVKKAITEALLQVNDHISSLTNAVTNAGATPVTIQPNFPAIAFENRAVFMAIAQVLHDLSQRVIKDLMQVLTSSENLALAIKIQTTDSRYASLWAIARNTATPQFYPSQDYHANEYITLPQPLSDYGNANGVDIAQTVYQNENNTQQAGTNLSIESQIAGYYIVGAFDEPLAETEARKVLNIFKS